MGDITRRGLASTAFAAAATPALARSPLLSASAWPDATELAARIRRREISAAEVVETAIAGAEALQPTLNFLVNSDFDRALAKAKAGPPSGPFGGVPFLIKDLNPYVGLPTRNGSKSGLYGPPETSQDDYISAFDRAGLVVIGKSATPEYGFLPTTEPAAFGPTRNPWDLSRSSGGSSGGSSVAVAAGIVPVAHANDGGGSIRIPASCCGLFGLKPSRGRMLNSRNDKTIADLSVENVVSRSVRDSAALFALTEEPDGRYPRVGLVSGPGQRRLRIGVVLDGVGGEAPSAEVAVATQAAAKLVAGLGHHVIPTRWPVDEGFTNDFLLLWAQGAQRLASGIARATGRPVDSSQLEPFSLAMAEMARRTAPSEIDQAMQRLAADALAYDTWFVANQLDVVLSPVLATPPPKLGEVGPNVPFEALVQRLTSYVGYTPLHNVAGAAAMSVPLGMSPEGLPIGAQFAARADGERVLFELAYELEAAQPWAGRIPTVHV
jgi:amidase